MNKNAFSIGTSNTENNVINLSNKTLCTGEMSIIKKGIKFIPTPTKMDSELIDKGVEDFCSKLKSHFAFYNVGKTHVEVKPVRPFTYPRNTVTPDSIVWPEVKSICQKIKKYEWLP